MAYFIKGTPVAVDGLLPRFMLHCLALKKTRQPFIVTFNLFADTLLQRPDAVLHARYTPDGALHVSAHFERTRSRIINSLERLYTDSNREPLAFVYCALALMASGFPEQIKVHVCDAEGPLPLTLAQADKVFPHEDDTEPRAALAARFGGGIPARLQFDIVQIPDTPE